MSRKAAWRRHSKSVRSLQYPPRTSYCRPGIPRHPLSFKNPHTLHSLPSHSTFKPFSSFSSLLRLRRHCFSWHKPSSEILVFACPFLEGFRLTYQAKKTRLRSHFSSLQHCWYLLKVTAPIKGVRYRDVNAPPALAFPLE
jgi:hypothetical protein